MKFGPWQTNIGILLDLKQQCKQPLALSIQTLRNQTFLSDTYSDFTYPLHNFVEVSMIAFALIIVP